MTHKIIVQLTQEAQRAAILAGGNAAREQTFEIKAGPERARALALPDEWSDIDAQGILTVTVPSWASYTEEHLAGRVFTGEDWDRTRHGLWGVGKVNLSATAAPSDADAALTYAEQVASCEWLREEREERARRARERAEREEAERPAREERERAERAEREEREEREKRQRAEREERANARKAQIGALFGPPGHPERERYDEGATSQEEEEALIEAALTAWLPEADAETGAFQIMGDEAHRHTIHSARPGYRWTSKVVTGQEAFGFFRRLEAAGRAWADEAPGRAVEMWRASCKGCGPLADVRVSEGEIEWEGWIGLGNP